MADNPGFKTVDGDDVKVNMNGDTKHSVKNPLHVKFQGLNVKVGDKYLLQNVSGEIKPGEILAIMGPSGAGKSTLLNILAGRSKKGVEIESGEILINNQKATKKLRRGIGYVLQDDFFFSHLTVQQTLEFVGELRLPDTYSRKEKRNIVNDVIDELGLTKCKNTVMGGGLFVTGCSGGEKKRCGIAAELITNPSLLIMDEPTSGLDSTTAYNLIDSVKKLAKTEHRAVVTTIHQPPSHVFHMFDKLLLVVGGKVAYFGETCKAIEFFESLDMPCYKNWNPADFIMDKLSSGKETEELITSNFESYKNKSSPSSPKNSVDLSNTTPESPQHTFPHDKTEYEMKTKDELNTEFLGTSTENLNKVPKWPTSYFTQVRALCKRAFIQTRKEVFDRINFLQTCLIGLIAGLLWFDTPYTEEVLTDRRGVIFFALVYLVINPMFVAIMGFPAERNTIAKERAAGMYRLSSYYTAKNVSELPIIVIQPVILYTLIYWLSGLNRSAMYLVGVLLIVSISFLGQSIGLCIGAAVKNFKKSIAFTIVFALTVMLLGGFYTTRIPSWLRWGKYVSHVAYAYNVLMKIEFEYAVEEFKCANPSNFKEICSSNSSTGYIPGKAVADSLSYIDVGLAPSFAIIWAYIIFFRALFYLVLRYFNKPE